MHRPRPARSIVALLEQEQIFFLIVVSYCEFFVGHLLICTGLTSVRLTYEFLFLTQEYFSLWYQRRNSSDYFLVTMSLLRLLMHSDVWGREMSFLVGRWGGVGAPHFLW